MLMQRFLTILILAPLLTVVIFTAPIWLFKLVAFGLVFVACTEWINLTPVYRLINKLLLLVTFMLTIWISSYYLNLFVLLGIISWFFILFMVLTYPKGQKFWDYRVLVGVLGLILIPLFYNSVTFIYAYPNGRAILFYILVLIWATDTGAYVAGKIMGAHKLIPRVSPGKTIEGAFGGLVFAFLIAYFGYLYFNPLNTFLWFVVALFLIIISMLGDLFVSVLKRRLKVKDTGHIFPGHGGMLDRMDSLIAAIPLFYAALKFIPLGL